MSENLFEVELAIIEDEQIHKAMDQNDQKRQQNHRKLAARRAIEAHLERQRLRDELGDASIELH